MSARVVLTTQVGTENDLTVTPWAAGT